MRRNVARSIAFFTLCCVFVSGCQMPGLSSVSKIRDLIDSQEEAEETEDPYSNFSTAEGKYPITWDLESLYKNEDEWQADYDKAMELLDGYEQFRGKLDNAETIKEYFDFAYFTELTSIQQKLITYANLGNALDASDPVFRNMQSKISAMNLEEAQKGSFVQTEIYSMPLEEREKIFNDPIFGEDKYWLKNYTDPDYEPLSEEESLIASTLSLGYFKSEDVYNVLSTIELPYGRIKMPDGTVKDLSPDLYYEIMSSPKYDDDLRVDAYRAYLSPYEDFSNTFATLLDEYCSQAYATSLIDDYGSTLEEAMDDYELDTDIFDMLIETARRGIPENQRYYELHKKGLGLKEQYPYDMSVSVSSFDRQAVNYDDAVDEVIGALSVLGDDYTDHFEKIISSGHVDVYPTATKQQGAFETRLYTEDYPWVMFNYAGTPSDVSTIAHEMGHAVYDQYTTEFQPSQYTNVTVFTQEVASTTNELLYAEHMLQNAKSDEEKLFYLEKEISLFAGTFFTQMMYSEFEDYMYSIVEGGGALDAEDLGDKWEELVKDYRGDAMEFVPEMRYQWASIPHFYSAYYVYQYAADVAYAASIVQRIENEGQPAIDDYLSFLKLGASAPPAELLEEAGVDPFAQETYDNALDYFTSLVDEYESLINAD